MPIVRKRRRMRPNRTDHRPKISQQVCRPSIFPAPRPLFRPTANVRPVEQIVGRAHNRISGVAIFSIFFNTINVDLDDQNSKYPNAFDASPPRFETIIRVYFILICDNSSVVDNYFAKCICEFDGKENKKYYYHGSRFKSA